MSSPRRIAVVILCAAIGFAVRWFGGPQMAVWIGLFVGMLIAPMVPKKPKGLPA